MTHFKAYCTQHSDFGSLTVPTENFTGFIMLCEDVFEKYLKNFFPHCKNIATKLIFRISATTSIRKVPLNLCSVESTLVYFSLRGLTSNYRKMWKKPLWTSGLSTVHLTNVPLFKVLIDYFSVSFS